MISSDPQRPTRAQRQRALAADADLGGSGTGGPEAVAALPAGGGRPRYLPALDGLRAVAVVVVVAFHLGRLGGGFLGVDVFFVLSGFLITRLLLAERARTGRISLREFWKRRVRRLLPAVLTLLPFVALAARAWLPSWRLGGIRDDALAALFYVANWRFVASGQSYFTEGVAPSPLRHTWSLAVEEQFYLLWPLLLLVAFAIARRHRRRNVGVLAAAVAVASAAWMWWSASRGTDLTRIYYGTDTRIFAMAAGGVVAAVFDPWIDRAEARGRTRSINAAAVLAGVALVLLGGLAIVGREDETGFYQGGFQIVALLSAVVVAGLATNRGPLARMLGSPPLRWVGQRSYSIYLWSWPVQIFGQVRFDWLTDWRFDVAVVAVSVLCASLSFALVERPVMAGRWPFQVRSGEHLEPKAASAGTRPGPRWAAPVASGVAVVAVAGLLVGSAAGAPPPPDYLSVDADAVEDAALSTDGFATGEGTDTTRAPAPTSPSTSTSAPEAEPAHAGGPTTTLPPLDPGPTPPFDPAAPKVVEVGDRRPQDVHGRPLRVLLIGDSVGWSLGWGMQGSLLPEVDLQLRALIGCGTIDPTARWGIDGREFHPYNKPCLGQAQSEELGFQAGPDVVLLWIGAWEVFDQRVDGTVLELGTPAYGARIQADVQRRVDAARSRGIPTLIPVVPCFGTADNAIHNARRLDLDAVAWVNEQLQVVADRNPGWVRLLAPAELLCDEDGVAIDRIDDVLVRHDGSHFDRFAAQWFWDRWLHRAVASAFPPAAGPG